MDRFLRYLFFLAIVRPIVFLVMGLNVRNRAGLGQASPSIIVANHNSHLDTLVLLSLFPLRELYRVRPVAAEDYFLRTKWLAWFALRIIGIIPLNRGAKGGKSDPLALCSEALARGETLIIFPEGSRGEPGVLSQFKTGVAHLAKRHPEVPVLPVFMRGLGRALPKGEWVLVPVICDIWVGETFQWPGTKQGFMDELETHMATLGSQSRSSVW